MRRKWILVAPAAILGILLVIAIGGEVVRQLWNWLLPTLFGWREITFWQALGMLALCRILFGGHGLRGSDRSDVRTAERRERFRQAMRRRFGIDPPASESKAQ
jgi:hypothetical protein